VVSGVAHAECYTRSATTSKTLARIERITDLHKSVLPDDEDESKISCRVTFRALIGTQWYTAESETKGPADGSIDQVCTQALNSGRTSILKQVSGSTVRVNQDMVCTDEPIPTSKPNVDTGNTIRESEVRVHPEHKALFYHRGSVCRWFVESKPEVGQVQMRQGIICHEPGNSDWVVVDKW
jgi:hypothetical protein